MFIPQTALSQKTKVDKFNQRTKGVSFLAIPSIRSTVARARVLALHCSSLHAAITTEDETRTTYVGRESRSTIAKEACVFEKLV